MYLCETCLKSFTNPGYRIDMENLDGEGGWSSRREEYCPYCMSYKFVDAEPCPKCGAPKRLYEPLCRSCMTALIKGFCAYADGLTAEEEAALDELLDGESVTNRNDWKKGNKT